MSAGEEEQPSNMSGGEENEQKSVSEGGEEKPRPEEESKGMNTDPLDPEELQRLVDENPELKDEANMSNVQHDVSNVQHEEKDTSQNNLEQSITHDTVQMKKELISELNEKE